jgi:hypothetical protein
MAFKMGINKFSDRSEEEIQNFGVIVDEKAVREDMPLK